MPFLFRQRTMSLILYKRILSYTILLLKERERKKKEKEKKTRSSSMLSRSYDKFSSVFVRIVLSHIHTYIYIYYMKRGRSRFPSQKKFQVAILTKGYLLIRGINKTRIRIYIDKSKAVCTGGSAKSYLHPPAKGRKIFEKR